MNDIRNPNEPNDPPSEGGGIAGLFVGLGSLFGVAKFIKPILLGLKWLLLVLKGGALAIKAGMIALLAFGAVLSDLGYLERASIYAHHVGRALVETVSPATQVSRLSTEMGVYAVVPDTGEQFAKVFARDASTRNINEMLRARYELEEFAPNSQIRSLHIATSNDGLSQLKTLIADPNQKVLSIIGHNDAGKFAFPNGDFVDLSDLARMCHEANKLCAFISCRSNLLSGAPLGVSRDITPIEAVTITKAISKRIDATALNPSDTKAFETNVREVILYNSDYLQVKAEVKVIVYTSGGVSIAGALLVEFKE